MYSDLLRYYQQMFELFDCFHFNSSVTRDVYEKNIEIKNSEVISITHRGVRDNRIKREFADDILQLIFIGNTSTYKGFPLLESVLTELFGDGIKNWRLNVWGCQGKSDNPNIQYKGHFSSSELNQVFHIDGVLVVPSVWYETFSLITLEALSFGIPIIVSSTVGAKDIVADYNPWFVFKTRADLKCKLSLLIRDRKKVQDFNEDILAKEWVFSMKKHAQDIIELYNK